MRHAALLAFLLLGCSPSNDGFEVRRDTDSPSNTDGGDTDPPTEAPGGPIDVIMNEIVPQNDSILNGPDGVSAPDLVEIVNLGTGPAELSRLTLTNADGETWTGTTGTLAAGERMLVFAGISQGKEPGLFTGWRINKDADELTLKADGVVELDTVTIADVPPDIAVARTPDITGGWQPTAWATPGEVNLDTPSPTLDAADETVFTKTSLRQIRMILQRSDYGQLNDPARIEVHAALEIDGFYYDDVGIKLKGSASYDTMDGKPAFIVDFNEWAPGTRFRGLRSIKLHNGLVYDPTRARDHITYKLARESGVDASRVGWAEVWVHGDSNGDGEPDLAPEYYGIYIVIEKNDESWLSRFNPGDRDSGIILEPNEGQNGQFVWGDFGDGTYDSWNYETGPIPPHPDSVTALENTDRLIAGPATDAAVEELWTYVDKDNFLTYLAWESVAAHTDGYMAPNNWRVYVDGTTHKVKWLPAGAEWTWENYAGIWRAGGGNAGAWCHRNEVCSRDYAEKVLHVANTVDQLDLATEFYDVSAWLDPVIQADPRYAGNGWDNDVDGAREVTFNNLTAYPDLARSAVYQAYPDMMP